MTTTNDTFTLAGSAVFSGFSVPDVEAARAFYADTLGLPASVNDMGILSIRLGDGREHIAYPKPDHVPAAFTVLNFPVEDVDAAVDALTARGVVFAQYDGMDQDDRGVMRGHGPTIAWFTDPAGNVLSLIEV